MALVRPTDRARRQLREDRVTYEQSILARQAEMVQERHRILEAIRGKADKDAARYIILTWARKFGSVHPNDVYPIYEVSGIEPRTYSRVWDELKTERKLSPMPGRPKEQLLYAGNTNKSAYRLVLN